MVEAGTSGLPMRCTQTGGGTPHEGRYAYANQSGIAQWNLARFAETLLPLLHTDRDKAVLPAREALVTLPQAFQRRWLAGMRAKLGLITEEAGDEALVQDLLSCMRQNRADFTNTWRDLALEELPDDPVFRDEAFLKWRERWRNRLARQPAPLGEVRGLMHAHSPAVIPRKHRVEEALEAAMRKDSTVMERLLAVLSMPYEEPQEKEYRSPPPPSRSGYRTPEFDTFPNFFLSGVFNRLKSLAATANFSVAV